MAFFQVFALSGQKLGSQVVPETQLEQHQINVTFVVILGSTSQDSLCQAFHLQEASGLCILHVLEQPNHFVRPGCLGDCGLQEGNGFPNWVVRGFFSQDHFQHGWQTQGAVHDKTGAFDEAWGESDVILQIVVMQSLVGK